MICVILELYRDRLDREPENEQTALAGSAMCLDCAAMRIGNPLDNRQPQAGPAGHTRARLVGTVKSIEHPRQIALGDTGAGVADAKPGALAHALQRNAYPAPGWRILKRVDNHIQQRLLNSVTVAQHLDLLGDIGRQRDPMR